MHFGFADDTSRTLMPWQPVFAMPDRASVQAATPFSIRLAPRRPRAIVVTRHPGRVTTMMTKIDQATPAPLFQKCGFLKLYHRVEHKVGGCRNA